MNRSQAVAVFLSGAIVASLGSALLRPSQPALADVTRTAPREAFKAGSERTEATLKEIADTLKRIDGRLERIEQAATRGATPPARK